MTLKPTIAIVGMACHFPGALQLNHFWENIKRGQGFAAEVPKVRWIADPADVLADGWQPDRAYSRKACLIQDFQFNPHDFRLDPNMTIGLDPLHHLTLAAGRQAFNDCRTQAVNLKRCGAIIAAIALPTDSSSAVSRRLLTEALAEKYFPSSRSRTETRITSGRALAARVVGWPATLLAMELGLGGNAYTLDAACASSSYAVKLACDELASGRADMMITGGVSRPECLYTQVGFSQLKALSPSGRCAPFDATADGLVVGEGAGILVLKRWEDALAQGDKVYGLIRGIGLSNDMRGNLLAPESDGQLRAMRAAYQAAGWSPTEVDYIECHGTGTPTGDKIELESLRRLWGETGWEKGCCAIGSVKSMIGHLLTAASAAGLIKTLSAMEHNLLPPSINFSRPTPNSPLIQSPFRVQTHVESWPQNKSRPTKRAAVSAFGFGGINAHLLIESPPEDSSEEEKSLFTVPASIGTSSAEKAAAIAVVGMQTIVGPLNHLAEFKEAVFNGRSAIGKRPDLRWKGFEYPTGNQLSDQEPPGAYLDELSIAVGEFQIPPNEIEEILPQQLLMLKTAAGALDDAGMARREARPRMGAVIGIDFDPQATNFHMRWALKRQMKGLQKETPSESDLPLEALKDACGPPLNAPRTLGALGGIVASRIAREFRLGGPSFVVSAAEASGLKALEIGARSLAQGEMDAVLVGGIDLNGDIRSILTRASTAPFSADGQIKPFDEEADGSLPGEGAVALVLKRLDDALAEGARIYATIDGQAGAANPHDTIEKGSSETYRYSLERTFRNARLAAKDISYIEAHGSGIPAEDTEELTALAEIFDQSRSQKSPPLLGSLKPIIGHTGSAAGLFSVVKACLSLFHQIIPPMVGYTRSNHPALAQGRFHLPRLAHYWVRNRCDGPRRALVAAISFGGGCDHVILEEYERALAAPAAEQAAQERRRPLGMTPFGLFSLKAPTREALLRRLDTLENDCLNAFQGPDHSLEELARTWYFRQQITPDDVHTLTMIAKDRDHLMRWIDQARMRIKSRQPSRISGLGGIAYTPDPLVSKGQLALVYPGSGNHYVGMGRRLGLHWPEVLQHMDLATQELKSQMLPHDFVPTRSDWPSDWEKMSLAAISRDPLAMIFGQVVHGSVTTALIKHFGVSPDAVIGYSLGQTAGYFATGAWPERGHMLTRMQNNPLFTTVLAGPCHAAREKWRIDAKADFDWKVAVINRPAAAVKEIITAYPLVRLLIINTPEECVIGGDAPQIRAAISDLGCDAVYLDGVVTVHCDAAEPAAEAYYNLHLFPTTPAEGVRYYSCADGKAHDLNRESAAEAILKQALQGFDFTQTIESAYADGVRLFVEMGPHTSCSRMIRNTLGDRPHLAESICQRGEDDYFSLLKLLGNLMAQGVDVNLDALYGDAAYPPHVSRPTPVVGKQVRVVIGGHCVGRALDQIDVPPASPVEKESGPPAQNHSKRQPENNAVPPSPIAAKKTATEIKTAVEDSLPPMEKSSPNPMIQSFNDTQELVARTHHQFLDFSIQMQQAMGQALTLQNSLLRQLDSPAAADASQSARAELPRPPAISPMFPREMCMEFAIGSAANVLGPQFAVVDTYAARVRLPDEPLMLVDRILTVEGEKGSLTSGRVVTEHDVLEGAWYLDGNRAPVCISVEAGQADLFLCAYLGIDLKVKGLRTYRLLDAKVCFHRSLPKPGETIRYDIHIEKFIRQQETYLFFFHFEGYIGNEHLITMTNGCAGFFTPEEVKNSGGIILTPAETRKQPGKLPSDWRPLAPMAVESYDDDQLEALRRGDLATGFGPDFQNKRLSPSLQLPGGRMRLIHRVTTLDPQGGRFGIGRIVAEADIHPDDWFLTCHFVDDMVMPGTLMYECCAHTLRIFLQRMGWVTPNETAGYEPKIGIPAGLKCRGPVTTDTRKVQYEVVLKEIGYGPEPYVIADAHMYADGDHIVFFEDMSLKMSGVLREEIEAYWHASTPAPSRQELYTRRQILEFAVGRPSQAFGEPYRVFDADRVIARLPGPPFCFMDRITQVDHQAWVLKPGGWIEAQFDLSDADWYFTADRSGAMPFCVLLEIALQPCGWLAAYAGSALHSRRDLKFRNLGGNAVVHRTVYMENQVLTMRARLTKVAEAGEMIIENFDFRVENEGEPIYTGDTYFGFFSADALLKQNGLSAKDICPKIDSGSAEALPDDGLLKHEPPLTPEEAEKHLNISPSGLALPAKALLMVDRIVTFLPQGGPHGLGYLKGVKAVDPKEWFFKAHFHQDPVCPGSLGIESFLQLLKFYAKKKWRELKTSHRFEMLPHVEHQWIYRGQIIPTNSVVTIEAAIKQVEENPHPTVIATGWISVDGLYIYKMDNFGLRLVPRSQVR